MNNKKRDYKQLAVDILEIVKDDNIVSATRCATRLRLVLRNSDSRMKEELSNLTGVITVVESAGQVQVVIGTHVGDVYDELMTLTNIDDQTDSITKASVLSRVIATMSAVFAPFIYILAAAGILQGALILLNLAVPSFSGTGTYQVFSFISWAPFTFLPIFIAVTASKHFKSNMYIAIACCAALVSPTWAEMATSIANGSTITFLQLPLSETVYTSSVLPPLILVWILSYLEKFMEKIIPSVVRSLFVPLVCLVIMVPLTLLVFGPVSSSAAGAIANGYNYLSENVPYLAAAIIGGFWQVIVIFGVHWGSTPMVLANFEMFGKDSFTAYQTIAVIAQVGAVLAVFIKSRDKVMKNVSFSAFLTGIFGITEPAIYGVTLRLKKPFIYGCISGGVGAVVASFFNPYYYAYAGLPGILTIVNSISEENPSSFTGMLIGSAVALIGPLLLMQIFGTGETKKSDKEITAEVIEEKKEDKEYRINGMVKSPLSGTLVPLSEVDDQVFSTGMMGKGVAIKPNGSQILAPFPGTITAIFESNHAIGLTSNDGIELLIHVGLETVNMKGEGFSCTVKKGQIIQEGDLLLTFDKEKIHEAGYTDITMVIISNSDLTGNVIITENKEIGEGEFLLKSV